MKNLFTLIGACTVLAFLMWGAIFAGSFVKVQVARLWAKLPRIAIVLPPEYHHSGEPTQPSVTTKNGVTLLAKMGAQKIKDKGYLLVKLSADQNGFGNVERRVPLNVAIVVDRSGSMSGQKLESVKQALLNVAPFFTTNDKVSLVIYDDQVQTLYSGYFQRDSYDSYVRQITAGGNTNIEGGLRTGMNTFDHGEGFLNHVILLSDGLANVGVSTPHGLAGIVEQSAQSNITVTTIGVGSDYDENIMNAIARAGHGKYFFMESPTQAEQMFSEQLRQLSSVTAKDIEVSLELENGFTVVRGVGYEMKSGSTFYPQDISAGRTVSYLFEIDANSWGTGSSRLGNIRMNYFNTQTQQQEQMQVSVHVDRTLSEINPLSDDEVYEEYMKSHVAEEMWKVDQYLEDVQNDKASDLLNQIKQDLEPAAARLPNVFSDDLEQAGFKINSMQLFGAADVNTTEQGRTFKKQTNEAGFSIQYNK